MLSSCPLVLGGNHILAIFAQNMHQVFKQVFSGSKCNFPALGGGNTTPRPPPPHPSARSLCSLAVLLGGPLTWIFAIRRVGWGGGGWGGHERPPFFSFRNIPVLQKLNHLLSPPPPHTHAHTHTSKWICAPDSGDKHVHVLHTFLISLEFKHYSHGYMYV